MKTPKKPAAKRRSNRPECAGSARTGSARTRLPGAAAVLAPVLLSLGWPSMGAAQSGAAQAAVPVFTVYAPDYFTSEWGPGPKIEAGFEAICGCDLKFVAVGEVLPQILLEGERIRADAVIGLTSDGLARARATGLFAPHGQDLTRLSLPVDWSDDTFLPFNWSQTAFVYDKTRLAHPPASFADLVAAPDDLKIAIQDPRSSVAGLATVLWVKAIYGDQAGEVWQKLAPKILTVTPGWSESYGLFTEGEVDMVLSFTTSPAYHIIAEGDDTKAAAIFPEGHYFMTEVAAVLKGSSQPELGARFMGYILSDEFQGMIATANWSWPVVDKPGFLPPGFADLPRPQKTLFYTEAEAEALRAPAIEEWRKALRQ